MGAGDERIAPAIEALIQTLGVWLAGENEAHVTPTTVTNAVQDMEDAIRSTGEISTEDAKDLYRLLIQEPPSRLTLRDHPRSLARRLPTSTRGDSTLTDYTESLRRCYLSSGGLASRSAVACDAWLKVINEQVSTSVAPTDAYRLLIRPFFIQLSGFCGQSSMTASCKTVTGDAASISPSDSLLSTLQHVFEVITAVWNNASHIIRSKIVREVARVAYTQSISSRLYNALYDGSTPSEFRARLTVACGDTDRALRHAGTLACEKGEVVAVVVSVLAPLLRSASTELVDEHFMPSLKRGLKRAPAVAIEVLGPGGLLDILVKARNVPSEFVFNELLETVLPVVENCGKEDPRLVSASSTLRSIMRSAAMTNRTQLLNETASKLLTAASKSAQVFPRTALVEAAKGCLTEMMNVGIKPDGKCIQELTSLTAKESSEDIRRLLLETQAGLAGRFFTELQDSLKTWLSAWEKTPTARSNGLLRLARILVKHQHDVSSDLIDTILLPQIDKWLLPQLSSAVNKPTSRTQSAQAWETLMTMHSLNGPKVKAVVERTFAEDAQAKKLLSSAGSHFLSTQDLNMERAISGFSALQTILACLGELKLLPKYDLPFVLEEHIPPRDPNSHFYTAVACFLVGVWCVRAGKVGVENCKTFKQLEEGFRLPRPVAQDLLQALSQVIITSPPAFTMGASTAYRNVLEFLVKTGAKRASRGCDSVDDLLGGDFFRIHELFLISLNPRLDSYTKKATRWFWRDLLPKMRPGPHSAPNKNVPVWPLPNVEHNVTTLLCRRFDESLRSANSFSLQLIPYCKALNYVRLRKWSDYDPESDPELLPRWLQHAESFYRQVLLAQIDHKALFSLESKRDDSSAPGGAGVSRPPSGNTSTKPPASATAKPKSAPKATARPKVSAATARLLAAQKATVKKMDTTSTPPSSAEPTGPKNTPATIEAVGEKSVSAQKREAVERVLLACQGIRAAVSSWPVAVARVLPDLVPILLEACKCSLSALGARVALEALVQAYVDPKVVPQRQLLAPCLRAFAIDNHRVATQTAEVICSSLSEDHPLDAEAAALVLPVVLGFLRAEASVSLVAVHRATSVLRHQLRLGAQLRSATAMECVRAIVNLRPGLIPMCTSILETVPSLFDFGDAASIRQFATFTENENTKFRRSTVGIIRQSFKAEWKVHTGDPEFASRMYCVAHGDTDEQSKEMAGEIVQWPEVAAWASSSRATSDLIPLLAGKSPACRRIVGRALAYKCAATPSALLKELRTAYLNTFVVEKKIVSMAEQFQGFALRQEDLERLQDASKDELTKVDDTPWHPGRSGCISTMLSMVQQQRVDTSVLEEITTFITEEALMGGWIDPNVQQDVETLGMALCNANVHEARRVLELLLKTMAKNSAISPQTLPKAAADARVSVAAMMIGTQVKHLAPNKDDDLVEAVYKAFSQHLISPASSLSVKRSIGKAMAPVFATLLSRSAAKGLGYEKQTLYDEYMSKALNERDVKVRVGGAIGLAALIKSSSGLTFLKEHNVIEFLGDQVRSRKEVWSRHGGFLCFEAIMESLGRLVEPLAVQILPILLTGLSDLQSIVREAAGIVSRKLMGLLSGHGLRLVLPELIKSSRDPNWRTKVGSLELLSGVAAVSPAHLASVLTQVLPVLCEACHDSHKEVKAMATYGLNLLGKVINSPELKEIMDTLLTCLVDGRDSNLEAFLDQLTNIQFEYYLDGSALSFLLPVLQKTLGATRSELRLRGTQVLGVVAHLVKNPKEVLPPYVQGSPGVGNGMLQDLKNNLSDPLPEVRQISSKCLGLLTTDLGHFVYQDLIPWLIKQLKSPTGSSVERSGCANALVEVFYSLGKDTLGQHLPDILKQASGNVDPNIREGFLGLFVYMPLIFREQFEDFVPQVLPVLLSGLASEEEPVRDIAYRASHIFVAQYGSTHTPLLLQPLENALFHENIEVRLRAVNLLGALVEKILKGVEDSTAEGGQLMQLEILSLERRAYILSALFLARSDDEIEVRHTAASVWKTVVQNTPKTVRELLPILTKRLVDLLASEDLIKETIASKCMEELIMKHGERLMPELMNIFLTSLKGGDAPNKSEDSPLSGTSLSNAGSSSRGVFIGLQSIIASAPRAQLKQYTSQLTPLITDALKKTQDPDIRKQIVNVVTLLAKSEEQHAQGGRAAASNAEKSGARKFVEPFLEEYFAPPAWSLGGFSDRRLEVLKTLEVFLETQAGPDSPAGSPLPAQVLQKCLREPVDLSKVKLAGSLSVCTGEIIRHNWDLAMSVMLKCYHNVWKSDNGCASADLPCCRSEIVDAVGRLIRGLPETFAYEVVTTITERLGKYAASLSCSAETVRELRQDREDDSINGAWVISEFEAGNLNIEDEEGYPVQRGLACLVAVALFNHCQQNNNAEPIRDSIDLLTKSVLQVALAELNPEVSECASQAVIALSRMLPRDIQAGIGLPVFEVIQNLTCGVGNSTPLEPPIQLPGCSKRGLFESISALMHASLLHGSVSVRLHAANAIHLLVLSADLPVLSATAIKAAGPLIRVFAERVPAEVKVAVLKAMIAMLHRTGASLRALVPQLQSTFLRCLAEPASLPVRELAAEALTRLATFAGPRVDLLLRELSKSVQGAPNRMEVLKAVRGVSEVALKEVQAPTRDLMWRSLVTVKDEDGTTKATDLAGECMAFMLTHDSAFAQSVWETDVIPELSERSPVMVSAVRATLAKGDGREWLQGGGRLQHLETLVREKALKLQLRA